MLPVSTADVVRHTPLADQIENARRLAEKTEDETLRASLLEVAAKLQEQLDAKPDQPVYLLAVPDLLQVAAWRRDVRAAGASYPGDAAIYRALRADLEDINPANLEELIALVDEVEAANVGEVAPEALDDLADITRIARAAGGRFAAMEGDREFWMSVAPIVACRHFLLGWENVPHAFERIGNRTSHAALKALGGPAVQGIGFRIMGLMAPNEDQVGNSASPSRSRSARKRTPTARKPRTVRNGTSSAGAIAAIPAAS